MGLRQDQLAGAAGVGLRFIVELEAGKPTIQLGKAIQVLDTLGCALTVDDRS
ncbi:helix-turn-helix domain-containing protein [Sphingomonas sp. R86520]|uniref:helix-turn-helix domain-containing protein n=1 Tax=Sphingomonas sp. R86520 TaxID=3093859 RepID=UPI0036D40E13